MKDTIRTLNNKIVANKAKIDTINENSNVLIKKAIEMVSSKILELTIDYNISSRKSIKIIQTAMFESKGIDDKLCPKMKLAIKIVVVAHKRKVFDYILWDELSTSKINEVLTHLTVKEIISIKNIEDVKVLLNAHKTAIKEIKTYAKIKK